MNARRFGVRARAHPAWTASLAILALTGVPAGAQDEPAGGPRSGRIRHVLIRGDLEALAPVARLGDEIERARREGDGLVIIEMDGDRGRSEVALAVFEAVRGSRTPVAAYLADPRDRAVGAAQLAACLAAKDRLIEPGTSVRASAGDDLAHLSSPDADDVERVARELSGAAYARFADMGAPADLASLLVPARGEPWPRDAWALFPAGSAPMVVFEEPQGSAEDPGAPVKLSARARAGGVLLVLDADRLKRLGVVRATAPSANGIPSLVGAKGLVRTRVTIDFTLAAPRRSVERDLAEVDELLRRATDDLDLPRPPRQDVSEDVYRRAAGAAFEKIRGARTALERAEALVTEYPELTRTPAPGQTEVAGKASVYATRWRSAFQSRADRAGTLEEKAAAFDPSGRR